MGKKGVINLFENIKYNELSREMLEQLMRGAFLTVKEGDRLNTMTIAWGSIGYMWNKPIFTVLVRYSRYTYDLIDRAEDFTVSLPLHGQLREELNFCGSKSGRDVDKINECKLKLKASNIVTSPVLEDCDLHFECKIVYKQPMDPSVLNEIIKNKMYPNDDYHMMYFGEIVASYIRE